MASSRIEGLDVARAIAIFGMLMVNFKVVMEATAAGPDWLIAIANLFEGRASSIFVVLAGAGISLMTRRARESQDQVLVRNNRRTIQKRALFLFAIGIGLYALNWTGDILHYYGVYLGISSLFITASNRMLLGFSVGFAVAAQLMQITLDYFAGWDPARLFMVYLDFWTIEGFVRNLLFNGYHPVFPWMSLFFIGMWIGRQPLLDKMHCKILLRRALLLLIIMEALSFVLIYGLGPVIGADNAGYLFGSKAIPPNLFYILSNSSTAVVILILCTSFVEKFAASRFTIMMIRTGQMAMTIYVCHVIIGIGCLAVIGWLSNQTLATALIYSCVFFILSAVCAYVYRSKFKRGPLENLMRKISG